MGVNRGVRRFLVAIDGAGECDSDFNVLVLDGESSRAVLDRVTNDMDYGRDSDGVAYVVDLDDVEVFRINESTTKIAASTTFDKVVAGLSPVLREYMDPDGGHEAARCAYQADQEAAEVREVERSRKKLMTPVDPEVIRARAT